MMYLQVAVLGMVNTTPELKEISRAHFQRLNKTIYKDGDIDYIARLMYTKHIMDNGYWQRVYETKFLADYLVEPTPELNELTAFIKQCGGWIKFTRLLKLYAKSRLLKVFQTQPRNDTLVNAAKKLVEKVDGLPKDGSCH